MTGAHRYAIFPICSKLPEFQLLSNLFLNDGRFFGKAPQFCLEAATENARIAP